MSENTPKKKKRKGERPDGLIQVSLKIGVKPDGRPDRKYFYGHTRAEAERKRDQFKAEMEIGCTFSPDITVQEWINVQSISLCTVFLSLFARIPGKITPLGAKRVHRVQISMAK